MVRNGSLTRREALMEIFIECKRFRQKPDCGGTRTGCELISGRQVNLNSLGGNMHRAAGLTIQPSHQDELSYVMKVSS